MRPIILTFVSAYLPGYKSGGPIRSIANLVAHLGDEYDFRIVTSDRDRGDNQAYPEVVVNEWNKVGNAQVYYLSPSNKRLRTIRRLLVETKHDLLYLNSYFSPNFTLKPLMVRMFGQYRRGPILLAPRGEFSDGAQSLKWWKKRPYIFLSSLLGLYKGVVWQASTIHEKADIERVFGSQRVHVSTAPDLPSKLEGQKTIQGERVRRKNRDAPLRIVFISRISPMKNLVFAIRVLATVDIPIECNIFGPVGDHNYWATCKAEIDLLPDNINVTYHGPVEHTRVPSIMRSHDLFFLPTLGENFGHVILEAMAEGTPVLISDRTPWRGLDRINVGWDLPIDDKQGFARRIREVADMTEEDYTAMRQAVQTYAMAQLNATDAVAANRELLRWIVNQPKG